MPIKIIRQDITKIKCDAIVDPTDIHYSHGGGVDAAIHEAAGAELYHACVEQGALEVGKAVITSAFSLPCKYVIHTVGPRWRGGENGEESLLRSCYLESLKLATANKCKSIAIPLIASGTFGFPKDKVLKIAVDEISNFLLENEMLVYIVVFDKTSYSISEKLFSDVTSFIEDTYEDERFLFKAKRMEMCDCAPCPSGSLDDMLSQIDESFSQMLLRKIDERGMTDAECYKKANIDRKLFSKIRSDVHYKPSKPTALAFAISLELSLEETEDMLRKAGFALSHSNKFDIIIEYFISRGIYDIYEINEVLYQFDQNGLGV
ncbi:MAG: RNase III inhibitor [Ruminococcaceae bacterium]|nr:RNase III inhibitor [Oscillospiraceae bacterium]